MTDIIEVFLFVDPLSTNAYEDGRTIEEFAKERDEKVNIRLIPLVNFHSIGHQMKTENVDHTLDNRNHYYTEAYHTSLAFQAASMQGKKTGRQFLMVLQERIHEFGETFSKQTVLEVAEQVNLDIEMFEEDLSSDLSKRSFIKDQNLAKEMGIHHTPACVVQDLSHEVGYRVEASLTKDMLHKLFENVADNPKPESFITPVQLQIV